MFSRLSRVYKLRAPPSEGPLPPALPKEQNRGFSLPSLPCRKLFQNKPLEPEANNIMSTTIRSKPTKTNMRNVFQKSTAENGPHDDEVSSAYVKVDREWGKKNEAGQTQASKPGSKQIQDQTGFMLQRWQQEAMLDQPYNNLEAVKKRTNLEYGKQTSQPNGKDSSSDYFDPYNPAK